MENLEDIENTLKLLVEKYKQTNQKEENSTFFCIPGDKGKDILVANNLESSSILSEIIRYHFILIDKFKLSVEQAKSKWLNLID
jgi:hypothetical protein